MLGSDGEFSLFSTRDPRLHLTTRLMERPGDRPDGPSPSRDGPRAHLNRFMALTQRRLFHPGRYMLLNADPDGWRGWRLDIASPDIGWRTLTQKVWYPHYPGWFSDKAGGCVKAAGGDGL